MIPNEQQQKLNIDPKLCHEILCTYCDEEKFMNIVQIKAVPVLMMPPAGGHLNLTTVHCLNCGKELDLERAKKWAPLKKEERDDARKQMRSAELEKRKPVKSIVLDDREKEE